jgi:hypothetical protein
MAMRSHWSDRECTSASYLLRVASAAPSSLVPVVNKKQLTSESFPTRFRYSGGGSSYSLSAILGGASAPSFLAGLIGNDVLHRWFYVPVVYGVYCVAAMLSLLFIGETRDLPMDFDQEAPLCLKASAEESLN